jgi:hypothetical protein
MIDPVKLIRDTTNLSLRTQQAVGFSLPPIIPLKTTVTVKDSKQIEADSELKSRLQSGLVENTNWIVPLTFQSVTFKDPLSGVNTTLNDFKLPFDPIVTFSSKNIITRRYVSKGSKRGTIKEHWKTDDWDITITGVIIEENATLKAGYLKQLRDICNAPLSIPIVCDLFNEMDIHNIAIESYDFPHTQGVENQVFILKGYSDETYTLLIPN